MTKNNGFKVAALAASIALAMGATSAMAADPAANALPGQGKVVAGALTAADVTIATGTSNMTIANGASANVINWGADATATGLNKTGAAGFNIGSGATVDFSGAGAVLNIDSTGNASQIFGALTAGGAVFVANSNGIIVGSGGSITTPGAIGLIGNTTFATSPATAFDGTPGSVAYNGAGGDVTVQTGASLDGGSVFISGGGNVNVDLGALVGGAATINAGLSNLASPVTPNKNANVAITGTLGGGTIAAISSAGTASNVGVLDLSGATVSVKGVLTNSGDLTLGAANGTVVNQGKLTTGGAATFASLTNAGEYDANTSITINSGGNLTNTGKIAGAGVVAVNEGNINNSGSISGVTSLATQSDSGATGFASGGQYYINNTGSISGTAGLTINANTTRVGGTANDSTGSFTNTGSLNVAAAGDALTINANNNVMLGGMVQAGTPPKALSATNALGSVSLYAGGGTTPFTGNGALTVMARIFAGNVDLAGPQVKVMSNVTTTGGDVNIVAGAASATDYAVRVGGGATVAAGTGGDLYIDGDKSSHNPNVILQGTLSADDIYLGQTNNVSDVFSGPNGGLVVNGATPDVEFNFTGIIKTAKYLNDANFRYNYLPISAPKATGPVNLILNPTAYTTNGTSNGLSAVNILVNGDVDLSGGGAYAASLSGVGSAVTGVVNTPNTHLVLQSTGNIATTADFYWPGYVYLGTVDTNADGSAAPGTLSSGGTITLGGNFTNQLPGDVSGASGIHFMSGNALVGTGQVTTNANAWVNFPTDLLTQSYAQGLLTTPTFFGGTATGLIVNYAKLPASSFNTHPVDATK